MDQLERVPNWDHPEAEHLPVKRTIMGASNYFPKITKWWYPLYGIANTWLPIQDWNHAVPKDAQVPENKKPVRCTIKLSGNTGKDEKGTFCNARADFLMISMYVDVEADEPAVVEPRTRYYCSECMYRTMNRALAHVGRPEFYRGTEPDSVDPDASFVALERVNFLEEGLGMVLEFLEEHRPEMLERLNAEAAEEFEQDQD